MTNTILPDYAFKHPVGEPTCDYCQTPKAADGTRFCSDECADAYAAATLLHITRNARSRSEADDYECQAAMRQGRRK